MGIGRDRSRDHALRRGPYRTLRRKGQTGPVRRGLAVLPPVTIAFLLALAAVPIVAGAMVLASFTADLPSPEDLAKDPLALSTKVYDRTGTELLYQFEVERREAVRIDSVPQVLIDATIAAEDKTFWTNPGVDILGIVRAAVSDVTGSATGQGGASTITQQLVKQRVVGNEVSLQRKIREAILSIEVTRTYSKEQILELYFNQIYYGNQAYGVKTAAQTYFGKTDLSTLTVAEAALLAGLPQAPSVLDPSQPGNVERAKERRSYVLDQMLDIGAITASQRDSADAETIKVAGPQVTTITAPHFVFQVRNQLAQLLGGDESAVTRGGFKVTTTLDTKKQEAAERQVKDSVESLHDKNVWNAAMVSIDPRTGEILAYVGSVDYYNRDDPRVQGQHDAGDRRRRRPHRLHRPRRPSAHGPRRVRLLSRERRPAVSRPGHDAAGDPRVAQRAGGEVPVAVQRHRGHDPDRARSRHHREHRPEHDGPIADPRLEGSEARRHDERLRRARESRRARDADVHPEGRGFARQGRVGTQGLRAEARNRRRRGLADDRHHQRHDTAVAGLHLRLVDEHRATGGAQDRHDRQPEGRIQRGLCAEPGDRRVDGQRERRCHELAGLLERHGTRGAVARLHERGPRRGSGRGLGTAREHRPGDGGRGARGFRGLRLGPASVEPFALLDDRVLRARHRTDAGRQ